MLDTTTADLYVEWLAIQDAERAKSNNFMQESVFTPVYWKVKEQDDLVSVEALVVLGRILGYCQMARGQCSASLNTVAKQVHMSLSTVKRCVKVLDMRGYIEDLTPYRQKAPHVYVPTERLRGILKKSGVRVNQDG
jgi:hypothetical protein